MNLSVGTLLGFLSLTLVSSVAGLPDRANATSSSTDDEDCGLDGYEAHCVLDIMEEHIDATAIINHCHFPLDITFRVIYRYGNKTEQRWQYTFVTSNQNERVLIPGLLLPPAPHALVYLFVRVPQPMFDLHNASVAAVEASFVAMLDNDEWEEVEFLNDAFVVTQTDDCLSRMPTDPLLYILGGTFLGLLLVSGLIISAVWCHRRRKLSLDELALVTSIETGIPGAQPYQIGQEIENRSNNNNIPKISLKTSKKNQSEIKNDGRDTTFGPSPSGFTFGRLKEEDIEKQQKAVKRISDKAIIIGNPELVDKTSLVQAKFNRVASSSTNYKQPKVECPGDTFQNRHSFDIIPSEPQTSESVSHGKKASIVSSCDSNTRENSENGEGRKWENHPLESSFSTKEDGSCFMNGARPKYKHQQSK